jgi:hypothetical protein
MKNIPILVSPDTFKRSALELSEMPPRPQLTRSGSSGVLITCVHGYGHMRDGVLKLKDSGSLQTSHAIALASYSDWIAVGEEGAIDSNYHRDTPFKGYLENYLDRYAPKLVVDIHTSNAMRPFDVETGTLDQLSWLGNTHWRDALHQTLANSGFTISDNQVFRGQGIHEDAQTITSFCHEKGVPAVQLEISSALTDGLTTLQALHAHAKLVNAIAAVVARLPTTR